MERLHDHHLGEAFEFTPTGGKKVIGAGKLTGMTNVDHDKHMVVIYGIQVINTYFPDLDQASSAKMDHLVRSFVPPMVNISSNGWSPTT